MHLFKAMGCPSHLTNRASWLLEATAKANTQQCRQSRQQCSSAAKANTPHHSSAAVQSKPAHHSQSQHTTSIQHHLPQPICQSECRAWSHYPIPHCPLQPHPAQPEHEQCGNSNSNSVIVRNIVTVIVIGDMVMHSMLNTVPPACVVDLEESNTYLKRIAYVSYKIIYVISYCIKEIYYCSKRNKL